MSTDTTSPIPICLVTGFLGSGKTTFLKNLVERHRDRKLVFLVNEFSPHDIDGAIVSKTNPSVVAIPGGSIFCKCLVTEFISQMTAIPSRFEGVEGVVIEASGMANPKVIADMLRETKLDDRYALTHIVSIVDPVSFMKLRTMLPNMVAQIEASDTVLINKADLYDESTISETVAALTEIRPDIHARTCTYADADVDLFTPPMKTRELHGEYAECKDPNYESITVSFDRPICMDTFRTLLLNAEADIFRIKGDLPTAAGSLHIEYSKSGLTATETATATNHTLVTILRGAPSATAREFIDWLNAQAA